MVFGDVSHFRCHSNRITNLNRIPKTIHLPQKQSHEHIFYKLLQINLHRQFRYEYFVVSRLEGIPTAVETTEKLRSFLFETIQLH